jgi:hypothetical protein
MLICYISLFIKIRRVEFASTNVENRAIKKIISYVLIFIIHWIPIIVQNLGRLLKVL